jgi:hypothetical protein
MSDFDNAVRLFRKRLVVGPNCWILTTNPNSVGYSELRPKGSRWLAHRLSYELYVGPIPRGLQIDHLCRNRRCVKPTHLEAVTHQENFIRGAHLSATTCRTNTCQRGHVLEGANVYIRPDTGRRMCWPCQQMRQAKVQAKKRAARHLDVRGAA